jgi:hypothetical protein
MSMVTPYNRRKPVGKASSDGQSSTPGHHQASWALMGRSDLDSIVSHDRLVCLFVRLKPQLKREYWNNVLSTGNRSHRRPIEYDGFIRLIELLGYNAR